MREWIFIKILNIKCSWKPYMRFKILQGLSNTNFDLPMERGWGWGWELTSRQHFLFTDWIMGSAAFTQNPRRPFSLVILIHCSIYGLYLHKLLYLSIFPAYFWAPRLFLYSYNSFLSVSSLCLMICQSVCAI